MTLPVLFTAGTGAYNIQRSLRFRSSASAFLNRTFGTPTSQYKTTYSFWLKRGKLSTQNLISYGNFGDGIQFNGDSLDVYYNNGISYRQTTTAVLRDPSAWYHIVVAIDTTQATAANRTIIYINGVQQTATSGTQPPQNTVLIFNSAVTGKIGTDAYNAYLDGYLTEFICVDGQALTPSSFGQTNSATGVWQPIKYSGTYGTNGFYLNFSDNSNNTATTIGKDYSGNGNNWTPNNISVTSGATYDSMTDVPTLTSATAANYCVLNPLNIVSPSTISGGNLNFDTGTTGGGGVYANWNYPESGKFYHELSNLSGVGTANGRVSAANVYWESNTGDVYISGVFAANVGTWNDSNTLGFAADCSAKTIALYRNNSLLYTANAGNAMFSSPVAYAADGSGSFAISGSFNFGQQPFAYTPPTGFVALNTFNLPTPTIGATASSQANRYMDVLTWTGDGASSRAITGLNFQPDWVWDKMRSGAYQHAIVDSVRGGNQVLHSNSTSAEDTNWQYGYVSSFNSNGFTIQAGATSSENWNLNGSTFVAWNWKANGSGSTNTAGSITSTVSANTTAGFSIVTYTGTGANATVGHGLGVKPTMIIVKERSASQNWAVYYLTPSGLGGADRYLSLNTTAAYTLDSTVFQSVDPTSSVFSIGTSSLTNASSQTYVAYCFASVSGYSQISGGYTGNGSSDGPFVYTGFRPKYVLIKRTDSAEDWIVMDSARNTFNVANSSLFPNGSFSETTDSNRQEDFLSNGFKIRSSGVWLNASGGTYIYMAFAENPFKYSLAR